MTITFLSLLRLRLREESESESESEDRDLLRFRRRRLRLRVRDRLRLRRLEDFFGESSVVFTTVIWSVPSFFLSFGFVTPFTEEVRSRASTVSDGRDLLRLFCNKIIQSLTNMRKDKCRYDEPRKDVCLNSHDWIL